MSNGIKEKQQFSYPKKDEYFNRPWNRLRGVFDFEWPEPILAEEEIKKYSKTEILRAVKTKGTGANPDY